MLFMRFLAIFAMSAVLARIYTFFTPWVLRLGGGGFSQGIGMQPAYAIFHPGRLKN